jgi:signal transduction histidine kinase
MQNILIFKTLMRHSPILYIDLLIFVTLIRYVPFLEYFEGDASNQVVVTLKLNPRPVLSRALRSRSEMAPPSMSTRSQRQTKKESKRVREKEREKAREKEREGERELSTRLQRQTESERERERERESLKRLNITVDAPRLCYNTQD